MPDSLQDTSHVGIQNAAGENYATTRSNDQDDDPQDFDEGTVAKAIENTDVAISLMDGCMSKTSLAPLESMFSLAKEIIGQLLDSANHSLIVDASYHLAHVYAVAAAHFTGENPLRVSRQMTALLKQSSALYRSITYKPPREVPAITQEDRSGEAVKQALETAKEDLMKFAKSISLDSVNTVIVLLQQSIPIIQSVNHPRWLAAATTLARGLHTRFYHLRNISDLDHAISTLQDAIIGNYHDLDPSICVSICLLCALWLSRFEFSRDINDAECADSLSPNDGIDIALGPYIHFAVYLKTRTIGPGDNSLDVAINILDTWHTKIPEFHLDSLAKTYLYICENYATSLLHRYNFGGQQSDLNDSIVVFREVLTLHPDLVTRFVHSVNLASALLWRYVREGRQDDLNQSVSIYRQSLELLPPEHDDRPVALLNLAIALSTRFQYVSHEGTDLDEAMLLTKMALQSQQVLNLPAPQRARYVLLRANVLSTDSRHRDSQASINEAILLYRQCFELGPPSAEDRTEAMRAYAGALRTRYSYEGQERDLDEAISLYRQVRERQPPSRQFHRFLLNGLSGALADKYELKGQRGDLNEAISLRKEAIKCVVSSNSFQSNLWSGLGDLLMKAYAITKNAEDLDQAMSAYESAVGRPEENFAFDCFKYAKIWARHADQHKHPSVVQAYDTALQVLPRMASLALDLYSRQKILAFSDGIARDAARCAIHQGRLPQAVEYLEEGRAVLWSQLLHLRSPFDELRDANAELESRLRQVAASLEQASHRDMDVVGLDNQRKIDLEEETARFERLQQDWAKGLDEVRHLEGFEDFLLPRRLSALNAAAAENPVVMLVANMSGSDCIIMESTGLKHIPLSRYLTNVVLSRVADLVKVASSRTQIPISLLVDIVGELPNLPESDETAVLLSILQDRGEEQRLSGKRVPTTERTERMILSDDIFRYVLGFLWREVVEPIVKALGLEKSDPPTKGVYWCPAGIFTFLPIHAAGIFKVDQPAVCASDYMISSYTPTIGALLPRNVPGLPPSDQPFEMMVVVDTERLPFTKTELQHIKKRVPNEHLVQLGVPGAPADVEAMIAHLPTASIVHFACHGFQDEEKPLDSYLLGATKIDKLTIAKIMQQLLPHGSLAVLFACETAMGYYKLSDEAISLGASLLFSGFQSVVATMWGMADVHGPTIADAFYEELFRGPDGKPAARPDVSKSAQALDIAVKKLRSRGVEFRRWVPFVHLGK